MKNIRKYLSFVLVVSALLLLSACGADTPEPTETRDPNLDVLEYTLTAQGSDDLNALDQYPNLQRLDLRGSDCYDAVLEYIMAHPDVDVMYDVRIGQTRFDRNIDSLSLAADAYDYEELLCNLAYLPNLTTLQLPETTLDAVQIHELSAAYPDIELDYTVYVLDQLVQSNISEIDLSSLLPEQIDSVLESLVKLPYLTDIFLMSEDGESALSVSDVKKLMDGVPEKTVHYSFELFDQIVSTTDETIEFSGKYIGDKRETQLREALDILKGCTYLKLDGSGISNEILAQIREDYPGTKIVWRVSYGSNKSCFTDTTVVRAVETLTTKNAKNLIYCNEVEYADFGHCGALTDMYFVEYMPNLKVCIIGDSAVSDLTPFASCKNLEYLELVNCNLIKDLSPLANCTNLKGLNLSYLFSVDDLSPLFGLQNLERLFMGRHDFDQEMIDAAREALPNCWVTDHAEPVAWIGFNYSVGWRLDDEETFADWYVEIMDIFGYTRTI